VDAADEIPRGEMESFIASAVAEAARRSISGKAVTPFILSRLVEITGGRSLRTNIALVKSNAQLAAEVALELA
jgi:pseudouridine-5'-phosphate glycosidase